MHILLIDDDKAAAAYLTKGLTETGHVVDRAVDGEDGLHLALTGQYDVLILDRMLPKRDGLTLVRMLRADGQDTPVLVLSALGEVDDRVQGLNAGGGTITWPASMPWRGASGRPPLSHRTTCASRTWSWTSSCTA
jgi:two-component system OmpR family response regulator